MPALPWSLHSHPSRPRRRKAPHTYFVGRRVLEATELFAVSAADVERLTSDRRYGAPGLDWRGGDTALELSHLLLERVAEPPPSRELTTHFARSMLAALPEHGFVLDSDTVWTRPSRRGGFPVRSRAGVSRGSGRRGDRPGVHLDRKSDSCRGSSERVDPAL
jgi:hypothetical protein